jgi:hypothetical protein
MSENEDIEKFRALLLVEAKKSTPTSRRVRNSKTAQVRALYPDLQAIKKRSPHITYSDLTKMLQNIGLDVKVSVLQKAMQAEKAERTDAKRAGKLARSSTKSKDDRQDGNTGKVHAEDRIEKKKSNPNVGKVMSTLTDKIAAESIVRPLPERFPIPSTPSRFLELEEKL